MANKKLDKKVIVEKKKKKKKLKKKVELLGGKIILKREKININGRIINKISMNDGCTYLLTDKDVDIQVTKK